MNRLKYLRVSAALEVAYYPKRERVYMILNEAYKRLRIK